MSSQTGVLICWPRSPESSKARLRENLTSRLPGRAAAPQGRGRPEGDPGAGGGRAAPEGCRQDARAATAQRLKEEAETAEALAGLHKEQADAVRRMMDTQLATAERRIRMDSIRIGIASFVAGGGVTFAVTLLVHPLHPCQRPSCGPRWWPVKSPHPSVVQFFFRVVPPLARASRMRWESPSVTTTFAWCRSRSSRLTAVVCSGRNRPQDSKGQ